MKTCAYTDESGAQARYALLERQGDSLCRENWEIMRPLTMRSLPVSSPRRRRFLTRNRVGLDTNIAARKSRATRTASPPRAGAGLDFPVAQLLDECPQPLI